MACPIPSPSNSSGQTLAAACEDDVELTPLLDMAGHEASDESPVRHVKLFPEAVVAEESFFKRTGGKAFENESLESFYKPVDSYEGRHRYDPE